MRGAPCFIEGPESTLFSRNASRTLAILPVLGLLSPQSMAGDPRNSRAPVGYLQGARPLTFAISSPSLSNGGKIPTKFTCDGSDVSPALSWTTPPPGTQSFTLIADDPDAPVGTWTHWVPFDLPTHASALPEASARSMRYPAVGVRVATTFARSAMAAPARLPANPIAISSNSMLWTECST